jgi:hypothetical protein
MNFINFIKQLWASFRSNPFFVAASSAAAGAVASFVQDELASGHIDWTRGGINKLTGLAVTAAIAAVVHLYRTAPGANPKQ